MKPRGNMGSRRAGSGVCIVAAVTVPVRLGMEPVGVGGLFALADDAWSSLGIDWIGREAGTRRMWERESRH